MLVGSRHDPEPYDWSMRPPSRPKATYSEIGDKARHNVRYGFEPEVPPPARMSLLPPTADIGTPRSGPFRGNGLPIMVKQPSYSTIHLSMAFLCSFSSYYPA